MSPAETRAELRDTVARGLFRDAARELEREQDAHRLVRAARPHRCPICGTTYARVCPNSSAPWHQEAA